jgi:putative addiction module component (TIGR02574 family)
MAMATTIRKVFDGRVFTVRKLKSRHRQFIKNLLDDRFAGFSSAWASLALATREEEVQQNTRLQQREAGANSSWTRFKVVNSYQLGKIWPMPITLDQIVEETREMPSEVVAELVDRILVTRHGGVEASIDSAWKAEASRRTAEIDSGKVKGVPLEESLARARKIAGL